MRARSHAQLFLALGALLFLLGLLTGFAVPALASARLGLSAHLEGVMNGIFLMVVGLAWDRVRLSRSLSTVCFGLLVYGTFTNWLTVLFAGAVGAGGMMPLASGGMTGLSWQEGLVGFGLISLSLAMVAGVALLFWGLVRKEGVGSGYMVPSPPRRST